MGLLSVSGLPVLRSQDPEHSLKNSSSVGQWPSAQDSGVVVATAEKSQKLFPETPQGLLP